MSLKRHIFLMYCGCSADGKEYRSWNAEEAETILLYKNAAFPEPFFPGVLLLAIRAGNGQSIIPGFGRPGNKVDWLSWLDDIFRDNCNLMAIAQVVQSKNLPPVDIWIAVPYPEPAQKSFGRVFNKDLNFSRNDDRGEAVKWWISRCLALWNTKIVMHGLDRYVNLRGFYWLRESMTPKDRTLLPDFISYLRGLGYKTLWIPYYAVTPLLSLQNPGFDVTVIQPSYLQNPKAGWQRLTKAFNRAQKYEAGIEIEFDTSALYLNSEGHKIAIDYLNRGLAQYEGYMKNMTIAYYTGYKTMAAMFKNHNPLYDHVFKFVKGELQKIDYNGIDY